MTSHVLSISLGTVQYLPGRGTGAYRKTCLKKGLVPWWCDEKKNWCPMTSIHKISPRPLPLIFAWLICTDSLTSRWDFSSWKKVHVPCPTRMKNHQVPLLRTLKKVPVPLPNTPVPLPGKYCTVPYIYVIYTFRISGGRGIYVLRMRAMW